MREEVIDKLGNAVYLTDERWQHIVSEHSKLRGFRWKMNKPNNFILTAYQL